MGFCHHHIKLIQIGQNVSNDYERVNRKRSKRCALNKNIQNRHSLFGVSIFAFIVSLRIIDKNSLKRVYLHRK